MVIATSSCHITENTPKDSAGLIDCRDEKIASVPMKNSNSMNTEDSEDENVDRERGDKSETDDDDKENRKSDLDSGSDNSDSGSSDSGSSDDESDSDSDSEKPNDGISAYERLRIERIRRNEERLKQLGLVDPSKKLLPQKKKKRFSFGGPRKKENDAPTRVLPKRSAKKKLTHGELLSGGIIDLRRSHPLRQSYKNRFGLQKMEKMKAKAIKAKYSKRYECGECRACKRQFDCQTCSMCAINQRPSTTSKRRCLFRMCLRRLVDVEVEIDAEAEKNEKQKEAKEDMTTTATTISAEAVDEDNCVSSVQNDDVNPIITQDSDGNIDTKSDESNSEQEPQRSNPNGVEERGENTETEEKGKNIPAEEKCESIEPKEKDDDTKALKVNPKISIDDSEYFASYLMEEGETGLPKWLDEFHEFMSTVPHGPMNRISGQKNTDNTMSQICKLVTGEGITYHLWPEGTHFRKGVKIHLGMDLSALHAEAVSLERRYEDRRKGSLLRHPIAKLICYKEWIADGKPKAVEDPPMSPLMALPPPTTTTSSNPDKDIDDQPKLKKIVTMTLEDRIQPNRVKWACDADGNKIASDLAQENIESSTKNSVEDGNQSSMPLDDSQRKSISDADVKIGKTLEDTNSVVSPGGEQNIKDPLGNNTNTTKSDNVNEDIPVTTTNGTSIIGSLSDNRSVDPTIEINRKDEAIKNLSDNPICSTKNETMNADAAIKFPSCCAVCSGDGDLICCDDCGRGYHSICHFPRIQEIPTGKWSCRDCEKKKKQYKPKRPKKTGGPKREVIMNHKLFEGVHDDDCYICFNGGDLICCDFCEKSFHLACHIPPLPFVPEGLWKCCECSAVERKKKSRCGECKACTRDDCGKCKFCLDKPKFGGPSKLKQPCEKKVCPYPRFAPPASSTTVAGAITCRVVTNDDQNTGKRKRGRPRKYEKTSQLILGQNIPGVPSSASNLAPIIVKKRGRPRKYPPENDHTPINSGGPNHEETMLINGSKKKRGRPRKHSIDSHELQQLKRVKIEQADKESVFRFKISSLDLSYNDETKKLQLDEEKLKQSLLFRFKISSLDLSYNDETQHLQLDEEKLKQSLLFRFKISSLKSAYKDPQSIKIRKIIKTAQRDPSDFKAIDKAFEHLRKCMKSVDDVKTAILFGGIETICKGMEDHPEKSILQAEACCTLAEILWKFPGISTKLIHMKTIDLIVSSIRSCPNNFKVQQMGCGALGALSYDDNAIQHIMDAKGVQAVVAAMKRFPKKLEVQKEGCYFIQNLIVRSIEALRIVSKSQVVSIIIEAISDPDSDTEFSILVCGVIANLAVDQKAKEKVGKTDAISTFISKLNGVGNAAVKEAACTAIKNLASGSTRNQKKILEKEGLEAVFDTIRSHPNDPLLLTLSFNVMKELCMYDEEVAHKIVKNGGIKLILKAMDRNHDLATMQVAACEIIGYLQFEGKSEIQAPKLVKAVVTAMKNHSDDSDVQIQACDALFELSQIPTTRLILKRKETQDLLARAKKQFEACASDVDDIIAATKK